MGTLPRALQVETSLVERGGETHREQRLGPGRTSWVQTRTSQREGNSDLGWVIRTRFSSLLCCFSHPHPHKSLLYQARSQICAGTFPAEIPKEMPPKEVLKTSRPPGSYSEMGKLRQANTGWAAKGGKGCSPHRVTGAGASNGKTWGGGNPGGSRKGAGVVYRVLCGEKRGSLHLPGASETR